MTADWCDFWISLMNERYSEGVMVSLSNHGAEGKSLIYQP